MTSHFEVHVLAPHSEGAQNQAVFDGVRVTRFRYFLPRWQNLAYRGGILANLKEKRSRYGLIPPFLFFQIQSALTLLKRYRFDLIHAHWLIPQGACAFIIKLLLRENAPPILCTSHGGDLYSVNSRPMGWLKRLILHKSNAVTVVSQKMKDDICALGADPKNIRVIPMGVDLLTRFTPPLSRKSKASILFVGRLVEKKGLRYLIEAMPKILEKHPDVKLRVAGDGQELRSMKSLSIRLGVARNIEFLGAVVNEALPGLYQTSEVVVFPSIVSADGDREGFGLVLVEALGCECAVVATDLPATRDIVKDGETALIIRQKDPRQIADKVIQLFDESELRKTLGTKGRRHVLERFDWHTITKRYTELIDCVIGKRISCGHPTQ